MAHRDILMSPLSYGSFMELLDPIYDYKQIYKNSILLSVVYEKIQSDIQNKELKRQKRYIGWNE